MLSVVRSFFTRHCVNSSDDINNLPFQEAMQRERKLLLDSVLFKQTERVSGPQKTNMPPPGTWLVFACCLALHDVL